MITNYVKQLFYDDTFFYLLVDKPDLLDQNTYKKQANVHASAIKQNVPASVDIIIRRPSQQPPSQRANAVPNVPSVFIPLNVNARENNMLEYLTDAYAQIAAYTQNKNTPNANNPAKDTAKDSIWKDGVPDLAAMALNYFGVPDLLNVGAAIRNAFGSTVTTDESTLKKKLTSEDAFSLINTLSPADFVNVSPEALLRIDSLLANKLTTEQYVLYSKKQHLSHNIMERSTFISNELGSLNFVLAIENSVPLPMWLIITCSRLEQLSHDSFNSSTAAMIRRSMLTTYFTFSSSLDNRIRGFENSYADKIILPFSYIVRYILHFYVNSSNNFMSKNYLANTTFKKRLPFLESFMYLASYFGNIFTVSELSESVNSFGKEFVFPDEYGDFLELDYNIEKLFLRKEDPSTTTSANEFDYLYGYTALYFVDANSVLQLNHDVSYGTVPTVRNTQWLVNYVKLKNLE